MGAPRPQSPMTPLRPSTADRVQSFIEAVDIYEPRTLTKHTDAFRAFARAVSTRIDGRYLDRHPVEDLLPDLESLMQLGLCRKSDQVITSLSVDPNDSGRGIIRTCMPDQLFIFATIRLALESLGLEPKRYINGVAPVRRDGHGGLEAVSPSGSAQPESYVWIDVQGTDLAERKNEIERYIQGRLEAALVQVHDFPDLQACVRSLASKFDALAKERPDHRAAPFRKCIFSALAPRRPFCFLWNTLPTLPWIPIRPGARPAWVR